MKKKFFIGLFIFAAIGLFVFAHIVLNTEEKGYEPQQNLQAPIEIPDTGILQYDKKMVSDKPAVYMFYVDWCTYCRRFMPIFGEFAKMYENKYDFVVIDCERPDFKSMVDEYHIMGFPSLFVVDNSIGHKFALSMASMSDTDVMKEELDNYLKVRKTLGLSK